MPLSQWVGLASAGSAVVAAILGFWAWDLGRKDISDLQERTRQRSLSQEQRAQLISALKTVRLGGFEIWAEVGDPESNAFAEQLNAAFGDAEWGSQMGILPYTDAPKGITVRVRSRDKLPEYVAVFLRAANEIGLGVSVAEDPNDQRLQTDSTRAYLIVGGKESH